MIIKMLENLFSSDRIKEDLMNNDAPKTTSPEPKSIIIPTVFRDDVERLSTYTGAELKRGMMIELTLQELLEICPRSRRKSDAYKKLIDYLANELGVTLIIKKKGE